jgi:ribonuclease HI
VNTGLLAKLKTKKIKPPSRPIRFWVDGGMLDGHNPSKVGVYWSVYRALPSGQEGIVIGRASSKAHFTNNEAEWLALRAALRFAFKHHVQYMLSIHSDSQLIVRQFNKQWRCLDAKLQVIARECWELAKEFPKVTLAWRPRREMVKRLGH